MPKRKATAAGPAAPTPAPKKQRERPYRTPQNPFEAGDDEQLFKVERIVNVRWAKGARQYLVKWEGYHDKDNTWEPMENLVGCAKEIREYEKARDEEDKSAEQTALNKRQAAKDRVEAEAAALKASAAEAALEGAGDEGTRRKDETADADGVLKMHKGKKGTVWSAFDLTVEKPTCKLNKTGMEQICGIEPTPNAGTTNYWSHLWTHHSHHRPTWYEMKKGDGKLNHAGEAQLSALKACLSAADASSSLSHDHGGEFLSVKLPHAAKETLDRVTSEWVVDEDQGFNAASTAGFRRMMSTATNGKYDGCCDKTVKNHVTAMGMEGKQECADFHAELLGAGIKPAASGDLWSKNSTALFGLVSHGIRRSVGGDGSVKWEMVEKLAGAVPCSKDRHTGEHIGTLSNDAWEDTGLKSPIEQLFVRISDNGSNMIKGWEDGFQSPCVDHTMELSVNLYTNHPRIAPTLDKGRGQVGYFNSSVVGYNESGVGLHACQKVSGVPENMLTQDVKTRWRSTHGMTNSMRINNELP